MVLSNQVQGPSGGGGTDTDTTYQGDGSTINVDTSTESHTIGCLKVPNQLTASSPLTLTGGFDGSSAKSLTISGIGNSDLTNSTISGVALGGNLSNLTAGENISFDIGSTYNGSAAITISASGGGGGGGANVSQIDHTGDGNHYLPFFSGDGFTFAGEPTPNHIHETATPSIDGFLGFKEGQTIVFTKKIPVGWKGVEIKFGLFTDFELGYIAVPSVARVNIKNRLDASDIRAPESFQTNTAVTLSTSLVNTYEQMVVVEISHPGESELVYTGGGWIKIELDE